MNKMNKIVLLSVVGLILGGLAGALIQGTNALLVWAVVGAIIGFLAGWIWQKQSEKAAS